MNNHKKGVCHNCDKRYVGCHSNCVEYLDWRQQYDAERMCIREKKKRDMETKTYAKESIAREKRRRGNK